MINVCKMCQYYETRKNEKPCSNCGDGKNWEPIWSMEIKRPEMLPEALLTYERDDSRIPERIRVSFSDGTTAIYDLHTDQPAPIIEENIRIIRKWKQGYVNQPARRRRNRT